VTKGRPEATTQASYTWPRTVPGVGFELQHQGFWAMSLDIAQVPDQRKRESSRSDSDALYPAVMRRL